MYENLEDLLFLQGIPLMDCGNFSHQVAEYYLLITTSAVNPKICGYVLNKIGKTLQFCI